MAARCGAVLPGGFEVGEREIRGVPSPGMICSEAELGLGDDAAGILVLETDHAPPGTDFASTLPYPDVVFDLTITPNRPDAMNHRGLAREAAVAVGGRLKELEHEVAETSEDASTLATPEDILGPYLFLLGPESRGITGQSLDAQG